MCEPYAVVSAPPPSLVPPGLWSRLPAPARSRLLRLLAQLLERQLGGPSRPGKGGGHDGLAEA